MATVIDEATLTNAGERMIVGNMWGYWAHLSIYHFALPFVAGGRVLDVGCGAGYGSAHLARHGAKVLAFDGSAVAIEHSRLRYAGDTVTFEVADLNEPLPLGDGAFDLVFSSNVFEHVGNVDALAAECARVLAPGGVAVIAVPPICSAAAMAIDMDNRFHVHHIPPTAWSAKLSRFFEDVRCHSHVGAGAFADRERERREMSLPADQVTIRETDFAFPESSAQRMFDANDSITAVYVCRKRRQPPGPETLAERTPAAWREGEVAAQTLAAARGGPAGAGLADGDATHVRRASAALLQATAADERATAAEEHAAVALAESRRLAARIAGLEASTSWRLTAPLRAAVTALRGR